MYLVWLRSTPIDIHATFLKLAGQLFYSIGNIPIYIWLLPAVGFDSFFCIDNSLYDCLTDGADGALSEFMQPIVYVFTCIGN